MSLMIIEYMPVYFMTARRWRGGARSQLPPRYIIIASLIFPFFDDPHAA
jgi:hypothetical protein